MISRIEKLICVGFLFIGVSTQINAQENIQSNNINLENIREESKVILSDSTCQYGYVGIGISYAAGDASFGRPEPMISALYGRIFTKEHGLELALHYLAGRIFNSGLLLNGVGTMAVQTSWTVDATWVYKVQEGILKNFSFGIGSSLRNSTAIITSLESLVNGSNSTHIFANYYNNWALGGNAKLEYQLLVNEHTECIARLQYHQFALPFIGFTHEYSDWGRASASIGAFLRVRL